MKKITAVLLVLGSLALAGCDLIPGSAKSTGVEKQMPELPQATNLPTRPATAATPAAAGAGYQSGVQLTVDGLVDGSSVTSPTVNVSGKAAAKAEVSVNDIDLVADAVGNFSTNITLDEGENLIVVIANDQDGNSAEKDLTVTYNGPAGQ